MWTKTRPSWQNSPGTAERGEMSPGFLWVFVGDKKGEIRCFVYPFCQASFRALIANSEVGMGGGVIVLLSSPSPVAIYYFPPAAY